MSPSEQDLRASLRGGEGDAVDADRIMAAGAAVRAHRRHRIVGVAAAVVVVAAAGSLTGVIVNRDGSSAGDSAGDSAAGAQADQQRRPGVAPGEPAPGAGSAAASRTASSAPTGSARSATCPAAFPQRLLPGGGRAGKLFDRPAASITVCSYGTSVDSANNPRPASVTLTGSAASELQRSLENAPSSPIGTACTAVRPANERNVAFVAVDATGATMRIVTTTLTIPICDTRTTNGITVRFGWVPPEGVRQQLYSLAPSGAATRLPGISPSGKNVGSPVR